MADFTIVGYDMAPSDAFRGVAEGLRLKHYDVDCFRFDSGRNDYRLEAVENSVRSASCVLCGMSGSDQGQTVEGGIVELAVANNKRFGLFADIWRGYNRPKLEPLLRWARAIFVITQNEKQELLKRYPDIQPENVVVAGNPNWEQYASLRYPRSWLRRELKLAENEVEKTDQRMILLAGGKDWQINRAMIETVGQAVNRLSRKASVTIIFSQHPGDETQDYAYANFLFDLHSKNIKAVVVDHQKYSTQDLLSAADLFISPASSLDVAACLNGIPVISFLVEAVRQRLFKLTKSEIWEPAEIGATWVISATTEEDIKNLASGLNGFLYDDWTIPGQGLHFTKPQRKGEATAIIVDRMIDMVSNF